MSDNIYYVNLAKTTPSLHNMVKLLRYSKRAKTKEGLEECVVFTPSSKPFGYIIGFILRSPDSTPIPLEAPFSLFRLPVNSMIRSPLPFRNQINHPA